MTTISRFAEGLKKALYSDPRRTFATCEGYETSGYYAEVDWGELNAAIDEFAASFKRESKTP